MTSVALKTTLADRAAVLEGVPDHPALKAFLAWNPNALLDAKLDRGELTLTVAREMIKEAAATVQAAGYNFLEDLTAVDWFPTYSAISIELPNPFALL